MVEKINLSDLKNNPSAIKKLMEITKEERKAEPPKQAAQPQKIKHKVKETKAKTKAREEAEKLFKKAEPAKETPAIVVPPKPQKVTRDDAESVKKHNVVRQHITKAEEYFNASTPIYESMEVLFSTSYSYAEAKLRLLLVEARGLCRQAMDLQNAKVKAKAKLAKKGEKMDRKESLKYSLAPIREDLTAIFIKLHEAITEEERKREGTAYDDINKDYHVDLSTYDTSSDGVVIGRSNLMVTIDNNIDLEDIKRKSRHIEVIEIEHPIYVIKNALMIGFYQEALPRKINESTLEQEMANRLRLRANPLAKKLRHATSNRTWFYVPEYSHMVVKSLSFADRSLNSEFEAFKSLSNDPNVDDVRFFFLRAGVTEERLSAIIRRWQSSLSYQGRLSILTSEYNSLVTARKTERLRQQREAFLHDNRDLLRKRMLNDDRIHQIDEEKLEYRTDFSRRASHTGNPDDGRSILQHKLIQHDFNAIERVAVRGITDSYERQKIREGIHADKIKCRKLVYEYKDVAEEGRRLKRENTRIVAEMDSKRQRAFQEISGR